MGRTVIKAVVASVAISFLPVIGQAETVCAPDQVHLRGDWGSARFQVELADDATERAQGLMHRETLPKGAGMLFVYEHPQSVSFWMENTLVALDMIFVDKTGVVQKVHPNAIPLDRTTIFGGDNIFAVLEINAGLSALYGIEKGTQLRHPSFEKDVVKWPC